MLSLRFDGYAGLRYNIPEDEIGSLTLKNAGEVEKTFIFLSIFLHLGVVCAVCLWYNRTG